MSDTTVKSSSTNANRAQNSDQRSVRQHTGLRTLDAHYSAREVYRALHCPYPGTDVLREKRELRARASSQRAQSAARTGEAATAGSGDRRGESGGIGR